MREIMIIAVLSALPPFPQDEATKALTANIASNEMLYRDIDVTVNWDFVLNNSEHARPGSAAVMNQKVRSVHQNNGWFSLHHTRDMNTIDKKKSEEDTLEEYDGELSRHMIKNGFGNIRHDSATPSQLFQSHSLLVAHYGVYIPLSLLLSEGDAFRSHPYGQNLADARHRISIRGEETRDGLRCKVVDCVQYRERMSDDKPWATLKLWIAVDRNYLIHRSEWWRHEKEGDFRSGVTEAEEYQELEPGVWLTKRYQAKGYDVVSFWREGRKDVLQSESRYEVSEVKLNPSYPREFFQQIQFPKGMLVYEVENGKIIRSLVDGIPVRNPASPPSPRRWPHYLATALALAFALAGAWFLRRWRSRKSPIPV